MSTTLPFCGRSAELESIVSRWRLAADIENPSPQVLVIEAEPGLGKTRLALEFYRWLNEHADGWMTKRYWPDALDLLDRNLDVNPNIRKCVFEVPIPYLWWGLRAGDPGAENGVSGDAVATYDRYLAPHLVALLVRANMKERAWAVAEAWGSVGLDLLSSAFHVDDVISVGKALLETGKIISGALDPAALDEALQRSISRTTKLLSELRKALKHGTLTFAKTPAVILLDDAQFIHTDAALPSFVERLMYQAVTEGWPVLILITHWKAQLSPEIAQDGDSFARILRHAREGSPTAPGPAASLPGGYLDNNCFTEIELNSVADLSVALNDKLPGLTSEQSRAILDQIGGNPRLLQQIIAFLFEHEVFFEGLDLSACLTSHGLDETLEATKSQDIFKVVLRRLRAAPLEIQEAICLASLQGLQFANDLVDTLAQARIGHSAREALAKGEYPYSMLTGTRRDSGQAIGRFAERLFYQVATERRRSIKSLGGEAELQTTLRSSIEALVHDTAYPASAAADVRALVYGIAANLFEHSDQPGQRNTAQMALGELAWFELSQYSFESAAATYERLLAIEPTSWSLGEGRNRIKTWVTLANIYRNLNWPAKTARALRQIFWESTRCVPDGFNVFLQSTDRKAAKEYFQHWQREHPDWPPENYAWAVREIVDALLELSELARARPNLKIAKGDEALGETPFLVFSGERSEETLEIKNQPVPEHLEQAMFLRERAYALGGVLRDGEVEGKHSRLLGDLASVAYHADDLLNAEECLRRALEISNALGDDLNCIATLSNLGAIAGKRGNIPESDAYLEEARLLIDELLAATFVVSIMLDEKDADGNVIMSRKVESIYIPQKYSDEFDRDADAVVGKVRTLKQFAANVYGNLALGEQRKGRLAKAKEGFLRSLGIRQEIEDLENQTTDLRNLGEIARVEGDLDSACAYWDKCVAAFRDLERRDQGKLHVRGWTKAIQDTSEGMRAAGCDCGDK